MLESIKMVFENLDGGCTEVEFFPASVNITVSGSDSIPISHEDFIHIAARHAEVCPPESLAGTDINDLPEGL